METKLNDVSWRFVTLFFQSLFNIFHNKKYFFISILSIKNVEDVVKTGPELSQQSHFPPEAHS